ncbi:uncharacterized protein G2W53_001757 [Senna tora]|uniref:Uncharacterized protein n=1 Tax=Senna tora TaxID=362788 RepID=A0A834XJ80_9FABA|nr:uncharacterized protein G2W53_001757 [Senna tora]
MEKLQILEISGSASTLKEVGIGERLGVWLALFLTVYFSAGSAIAVQDLSHFR